MSEARTFGEFFDTLLGVVKTSGDVEAEFSMESWADSFSDEAWQSKRGMILNQESVSTFADDMAGDVSAILVGTCTNELYQRRLENGHNFLKQIQQVSGSLGVSTHKLDRALSPSEWVSAASR